MPTIAIITEHNQRSLTTRPNIYRFAVGFLPQYLRRQITWCPSETCIGKTFMASDFVILKYKNTTKVSLLMQVPPDEVNMDFKKLDESV